MNRQEQRDLLNKLNVRILDHHPIATPEVAVLGCINGFFIYHRNYYWIVNGKMPLVYADQLFTEAEKFQIRVAGGAATNEPINWATSDEYESFKDETAELFRMEVITIEEFSSRLKDKKEALLKEKYETFYVPNYHIDKIGGLYRLVEIVRNNNVRTEW